ncbi:AMP-binding protein [Sphingomonas sp.]|uniref:AMP-binding protein n=1 Tax=Sphingomonas sp. TaxID=28214 RepID=UPI003CC6B535
MIDYIAAHGRARGAALACVDLASGRRWSWAAFDADVDRAANELLARFGPASGARVATLARNRADLLILQLGCARAGAIFVPLNWRLAEPEIAALLADSGAVLLVADDDFAAPGYSGERLISADWTAAIATRPATPPPITARQPWDAPTTLLYTSGTSGLPKGVMISEANAWWGSIAFMLGNQVASDSVFLVDNPLFHTAGLFAAARTPLLAGGTVLISSGFDPAVTLARLADPALRVTHYFSVPQMAQRLWNAPGFDPAMLRGLTVLATGGAPNPAAQIERFVTAGIAMSDGFGMTETCSTTGMPVGDPAQLINKAGSIGLPYAGVSLRIVDEEGRDLPDGEVGELWVRGPGVTAGYWNRPALSAAAFCDGWFRSGDLVRRDADGFYFIVDRRKDMYISGGENVYPAEVETVLAELAEVAECAVIGVPDARWGEVGRAFVVAAPGRTVTGEQLLGHCRARLAAFKVPATIVCGRPIPRTASGKVQKHLLR